MSLKVFELYSGIGGMHFALKESEINAKVLRAIDINTTANTVYRENFSKSILLEKNIQGLTENDFNELGVDMILMSPPCQPHTRNGIKKDNLDQRSDSLLHIITLIPKLKTVKFILLENVKGFEVSRVRNELVEVLNASDYHFQEFLLTPTQFSIPNSRLRYYLLAKKKPLLFCFDPANTIMENLPQLREDVEITVAQLNLKYKSLGSHDSCFPISLIVEKQIGEMIPEKILKNYGTLFDIVTKDSVKSCCFTKAYGHFVKGTGSVFSSKNSKEINEIFEALKKQPKESENTINLLKTLKLRYFTPKEISKLMCFPNNLIFPNNLTTKQKYRLLGNSINVHVVGLLIRVLVS